LNNRVVNPVEWFAYIYGKFFVGYPLFVGYMVVGLIGASAAVLLWMSAIDKYNEQRKAEPISDADLDKRIESRIKQRLASENRREPPHWMADSVYTGKSVTLIVFFYGSSPDQTEIEVSVRCLVTTPQKSIYSSFTYEARGIGISEIFLGRDATRLQYPNDFQGAPKLSPGQYNVEWFLTSNGKITIVRDTFKIPAQ
jgi:hypothetical protein